MKTTSILIGLIAALFVNTLTANAHNNEFIATEKLIREVIARKIGMPEKSRTKVFAAEVSVKFSIDENSRIIVKEIAGENDFLNEYVGDKLHHSKLKFISARPEQQFEITISFR